MILSFFNLIKIMISNSLSIVLKSDYNYLKKGIFFFKNKKIVDQLRSPLSL